MESRDLPDADEACQNILGAARAVLADKKVSGARLREIAHRAGISLGTLHYYFPSKTGLFLAVLDDMQAFFERRQQQLVSHGLDAAGKLSLFADQQRQLLEEQPQREEIFLDFWGHATVDPAVRQKILSMYSSWRRDIRLAVEQGVQRGEFDAERAIVAPYLCVALLEGIALQHLPDQGLLDLPELYRAASQLLLLWLGADHRSATGVRGSRPLSAGPRKPYPTDHSDAQWFGIAPLLMPAKTGGRPRTTDLRDIVNALLYLSATGGSWRMLPHDFAGWQTVYAYARVWSADGTLAKIAAALGADFSTLAAGQWAN